MNPEQLTQLIGEINLRMKVPRGISDIIGRDAHDQYLTSMLATLAEEEARLEQQAEAIQVGEQLKGKSVAAAESLKKATDEYRWYKTLKLLREAIVEHLRGLRSHSRREAHEREVNVA